MKVLIRIFKAFIQCFIFSDVKRVIKTLVLLIVKPFKFLYSFSTICKVENSRSEIKLNIGSGDHKGENGWTNLDYNYGADVAWDLSWGIPFSDNRVSEAHSTHIFEHFDYGSLVFVLKEIHRILKPGAPLTICVPNARLYIEGYLKPDSFDSDKFCTHLDAYHNHAPIDLINYVAYMDGHHKIMYDEKNLIEILKSVGFNNCKLREFDPEIDLERRKYESLYVKAVK
jgi:predicted SAM-dependent methyltransferase